MTSDLMKNYINFLFKIQMSENLSKNPVMMLYDSFRDHLEETVIPIELTSICQPLNGNLKKARISEVCGWVKRSWDAISDQIIFNSFKKCSISNLLDGLEDDMVYEEIDRLIAEYEKENLEELGNDVKIVYN
ncbi:hypothetical protein C1646_698368 [Rhizophagus diaphanus]|nr:hypothetical protein C1646_698368 [Rhizophagus diaphanus] [Rhizophagus sp. MUCL 43196]